ncbi:putative formate acetyltransferase 2 [Budvicia aquatica]|uniref:Putative formate acetyltransferase 2 n=1 Tax=Budvicia aquatica TaxID=82979 RepID=A0A484ZTZ1_9GAMM|nr:putative formate acetyltransferase 2 [Budvicia aquatica]
MYNDEVIIPALQNRGVSLRDARDYCIIGCVEPQAPHRTEGWHDAAFFNVAKVLEITLNGGKVNDTQLGPVTKDMANFRSIDDFYTAFQTQMEYFVHNLVEACNSVDIAHGERCPLPFLSAMVDDCIGRGKSFRKVALFITLPVHRLSVSLIPVIRYMPFRNKYSKTTKCQPKS